MLLSCFFICNCQLLQHCCLKCRAITVTEAFVAQSKANNLFIKSACVGTKMVQDGASQISVVFVIPEEAAAFGLLTIVFFVPETKSIAYCLSANRHKDCLGAYSMSTSEGVTVWKSTHT